MPKKVTIKLTPTQAEHLTSLLTTLTGHLQYKAGKRKDGALDDSWRFWHGITNQTSKAIGFEAFCQPSVYVSDML